MTIVEIRDKYKSNVLAENIFFSLLHVICPPFSGKVLSICRGNHTTSSAILELICKSEFFKSIKVLRARTAS